MPVTQGRRPHVAQPDCPFAAAVHEGVAVMGVELGRRDHLRELLHVGRLNVHDVWHRESRSGRERGQNLGGGGEQVSLHHTGWVLTKAL